MKKIYTLGAALTLLTPFVAFAQASPAGQGIVNIISAVGAIVNMLVPILITASIVIFFYGLFKYIKDASAKGHEAGRKTMIAGLASIFIMVTLWGILAFAASALQIPGFNGSGAQPFQAPRVQP